MGFFLTVLTTGVVGKSPFGLPWAEHLLNAYGIFQTLSNNHPNPTYVFAMSTIQAPMQLLIATGMGFLGVLVEFSTLLDLAHIKVFTQVPEYLLAMQCIAFLLGPDASNIHGSLLFADGGSDALFRTDHV